MHVISAALTNCFPVTISFTSLLQSIDIWLSTCQGRVDYFRVLSIQNLSFSQQFSIHKNVLPFDQRYIPMDTRIQMKQFEFDLKPAELRTVQYIS